MLEFLSNIAHALNPKIADTPEQVFAWRQTVAISLVVLSLLTGFHISQARGLLEWAGLPGYASKQELAGLEADVRSITLTLLEEQIDRVTGRMCEALRMRNQSALDANRNVRDGMLRAYERVARATYRIKSCDELLIPTG